MQTAVLSNQDRLSRMRTSQAKKKKKKGITRLDTEEEKVRCKRNVKIVARSSSQQIIGRSRRVSAQDLR